MNGRTEFGTLTPEGYTSKGSVAQASMLKCPHYIIAFEHYREDGTCRCNDKAHSEMKEWGYKWKKGAWR